MNFHDKDHPAWKILSELVGYIPAFIMMLLTTNKWDGEYLVVAAVIVGVGANKWRQAVKEAIKVTDNTGE